MKWYRAYYDWREDRIVNWFEVPTIKLGHWGVCSEPFPVFYFFTNCNDEDDMLEEGRYQWRQYLAKEFGPDVKRERQ